MVHGAGEGPLPGPHDECPLARDDGRRLDESGIRSSKLADALEKHAERASGKKSRRGHIEAAAAALTDTESPFSDIAESRFDRPTLASLAAESGTLMARLAATPLNATGLQIPLPSAAPSEAARCTVPDHRTSTGSRNAGDPAWRGELSTCLHREIVARILSLLSTALNPLSTPPAQFSCHPSDLFPPYIYGTIDRLRHLLLGSLDNPVARRRELDDDEGMQQLTYASKSLFTTDAVVQVLLELVTAIGRQQHSEAVTIPAFTDDGRLVEAKLTLNAGSELVAVPVDLQAVSVDEAAASEAAEAAVADIRSRIRENERYVARPMIDDEPPYPDYDEFRD